MDSNSISRVKVLLVDGDGAHLATTCAELEGHFEVRAVDSASEALAILGSFHPHVVCTDFKISGMDGIALLRSVRVLSARTAGILVTALRELPAGASADEAIFAVVYKPYEIDTLVRAIAEGAKLMAMSSAVTKFSRSTARLKSEADK